MRNANELYLTSKNQMSSKDKKQNINKRIMLLQDAKYVISFFELY